MWSVRSRLEQLEGHTDPAATYHQQALEQAKVASEKSADTIAYREWYQQLETRKK